MAYEIVVEEALNYSIITLRNTETKYEAEIYSFGGLLNGLRFPFENSVINVVDGYSSPADAKKAITPFFRGAKLSPFPCRLRDGKYQLHQQEYRIEKYYLEENAIHGLLYDAVFEVRESRTDQESAAVLLYHHYDGSDNGFPFEYDMEVEWKLSEGDVLSCTTRVSHTNEFAIPMADGWHPYFSLDMSVDDCYLQLDSKMMLEFDDTLMPTGELVSDNRFSDKIYLKETSLDNCWLLDQSLSQPKVIFSSERLRLTVLPDPSYPYLQVYTPDDRKSIALECLSAAPDCFNNKMGLIMIAPNEKVSFTTRYYAAAIS